MGCDVVASPQKENGYTPIANKILDALMKYRIPGEKIQVLHCIFRMTYGYNRKEVELSNNQIAEMTGLKRQNVVRSLSWLESKRILCRIKNDSKVRIKNDSKAPLIPITSKTIKQGGKKACVWPKDFSLTKTKKQYAINNQIDPKKVDLFFEDFHDWAIAKGATYKDWDAAFRMRVRKAQEYGKQFLVQKQNEPEMSAYDKKHWG